MKKIIAVVTAAMVAASAFAVDFTAQVKLKGDIAYGVGAGKIEFFALEDTAQQDADLLTVAFSGEKAGVDFRLWANASDGDGIKLRKLDLWFKPIDILKVTLGAGPSLSLYTEKLTSYKVPNAGYQGGGNNSNILTGDAGVLVEANLPVLGGISLGAGLTPGFGNDGFVNIVNSKDNMYYTGYGAAAKVSFGIASAGVGFTNYGKDNAKYIRAGGDFGGGDMPFYAMLQAIFNINNNNATDVTANYDGYGMVLRGISIDNYFSYDFGAFKLDGRFPVTIRGLVKYDTDAEKEADYSYMVAKLRVQVPLDAFTFGMVVGTDEGFAAPASCSSAPGHWNLGSAKLFKDNFSFYGNPYIEFNVGCCALNLGLEFAYDNAAGNTGKFHWAIPFTATVNF